MTKRKKTDIKNFTMVIYKTALNGTFGYFRLRMVVWRE